MIRMRRLSDRFAKMRAHTARDKTDLDPMPTTYALIPGAGGSAWYWHRVAPLLSSGGRARDRGRPARRR